MTTRYRPRWPLLLTLIAGVGAVIGLTYVMADSSGEAVPSDAGRYIEGVAGVPTRVNPLFTSNEVEGDLAALVFSGLVRLGPKGDPQPDLAERWTVSPDGREYTFHLRRNATWHDGAPFDAEDVLFTIEAIQARDFQGDPRLADVFGEVEVEALDEHTVAMGLPQAFAPFLAFASVGILPEHRLGELDADGLYESPFNERPTGTGPFRLTELTPTSARLASFDGYHLGRPRLERLVLRFYRDDATLLNALREEEIEGALVRSGLTPDDVAEIDSQSRWVRRTLHPSTYSLVYLNPEVPAFEDARVRRALQLGLDRAALIESVLAGQALPVDSPIIRDLWAYVGSPEAYAYDPARAAALLEEAGWSPGANGRAKDGEPLRFTLATVDDPVQVRVAEAVARQWGALGARVDLQVSGASEFREELLLNRAFEAALGTIRPPGPDPDPYPFWHSSQAIDDGLNVTGFSDPESDRILEDARQTPSTAQRAEDYRAFQEIFARELPAVLLHTPTYQYVVSADVQGVVSPQLLFSLSSRFHEVHRWFVETEPAGDDNE